MDKRPTRTERLHSYSPRSRPAKFVFSHEVDGISPLILGKSKDVEDFDLDGAARQQPPRPRRVNSKASLSSVGTSSALLQIGDTRFKPSLRRFGQSQHRRNSSSNVRLEQILDDVASWLHDEKTKAKGRQGKRRKGKSHVSEADRVDDHSGDDEGSFDLKALEAILSQAAKSAAQTPGETSSQGHGHGPLAGLYRIASKARALRRGSILKRPEAEVSDDELFVPSCDVVLDNSKTLSPTISTKDQADLSDTTSQQRQGLENFKFEILRLSHTLKLKGWRKIPLSRSDEIDVERLSGALTNAVYVVQPPSSFDYSPTHHAKDQQATPRKKPLKLLLRIYGPHTDQLIDRDVELGILRRLARKHIGPRLLATFANGRFEEFLNAQTLRPQDLRVPSTSKQIAKRMRELHDGIELLAQERDEGPFVWRNWDKSVDKAEKIMLRMEKREKMSDETGYILGTSWAKFRAVVEHYREQLFREYGGPDRLNDQLVFAHNDAQYGNILRLEPAGESPLLQPANVHKQLVVIDFEYANANVPGLEFANHFTEWCYNYHDPEKSYACNTRHYPTMEEQTRFIHAYVTHRPQHTPAAPMTPRFTPLHHSGSFSSLNGESYSTITQSMEALRGQVPEPEKEKEIESVTEEIERLIHETQLWRLANSAQWIVWGIMQAKQSNKPPPADDNAGDATEAPSAEQKKEEGGEGEGEFDYLAYASDRALFFWGDCLQMGLVTERQLGPRLAKQVKIVPY